MTHSSKQRILAALIVLAAIPVLPGVAAGQTPPAAASAPDTAARNKALVAAAFDRWAAGTPDFFDTMLADDVVWTIKGSGPSAGVHRGRKALTDRAIRPLSTRLRTQIKPVSTRLWADGDHVIANWSAEAVARDGKPYRNDYVWILRMEDGRAVEVTAFLDLVPYDEVLRRID